MRFFSTAGPVRPDEHYAVPPLDRLDLRDVLAALAEAWEQTRRQPWLVNALCAEACFKREEGRDPARPITRADVHAAKEALVVSRRARISTSWRTSWRRSGCGAWWCRS